MQIEGFSKPEKTTPGTTDGVTSLVDIQDFEDYGKWSNSSTGTSNDSNLLENNGFLPRLTFEDIIANSDEPESRTNSDKRHDKSGPFVPPPHEDKFGTAGSGRTHNNREAFNGEYGPYVYIPQPVMESPVTEKPAPTCSSVFDEQQCALINQESVNER